MADLPGSMVLLSGKFGGTVCPLESTHCRAYTESGRHTAGSWERKIGTQLFFSVRFMV